MFEWLFGGRHSYKIDQWVRCKDKKMGTDRFGQVTSLKPLQVSVGGTNELVPQGIEWDVVEPVDQSTAIALQKNKNKEVEMQGQNRKLAEQKKEAEELLAKQKENATLEQRQKVAELERQKDLLQQEKEKEAQDAREKEDQLMKDGPKTCRKSDKNHNMTFYVYTVQGDDANIPAFPSHADVGIVTYSLQGVMWHLHNRIVTKSCPRGQKVTRIQRYKAIVYNTDVPYTRWGGQFGPFMNYSHNGEGICKGPEGQEGHCGSLYSKYGNVVGCLSWQPYMGGNSYGNATNMYSLPGMRNLSDRNSGWCESPDGQNTCTWNLTRAGEVTLDQLANITDYSAFCAAGHFEYDSILDRGNGSSFWDGRGNSTANDARAVKLHKLFLKLFPNKEFPYGLPEPVCDGQNAECAYIDACRKTGLSGNCCPTDNGNSLECCPRRINQQVFQ